jgi:hypothetical protein
MTADPISRQASYVKAERELTELAVKFSQRHPQMGALLLECSGLQPFARSVQQAIGMPVFSWGTLLDYAYSIAVHRDYYGHV